MTQAQAAVIQPLLVQAGLDSGQPPGQQQQQQQQRRPGNSRVQQSAFVPLNANSAGPAVSSVVVPSSAVVVVHTGAGGRLCVKGLLDVTEEAWGVLQAYKQQQQQRMTSAGSHILQQQQQLEGCSIAGNSENTAPALQQQEAQQQNTEFTTAAAPKDDAAADAAAETEHLVIPCNGGLCLLRVTTNILQLLLTHHPHPGVRQQLYLSGLLPVLHLQDQVLACVLNLRRRLAAEQSAKRGYVQLVLAGSCLGGGGVGRKLVEQLLPFARQHAESEWRDLQGVAARLARADGRVVGAEGAVAPWDVAYTSMRLVSDRG
jgi:hypothetical protein